MLENLNTVTVKLSSLSNKLSISALWLAFEYVVSGFTEEFSFAILSCWPYILALEAKT